MLAVIKSCLSPLLPYAKLDECFIELLFQHQERETNCLHIMSLPLELHHHIINVKDLLLILGVKQRYILFFMFDFNLQWLSQWLKKIFWSSGLCPPLSPASDSVQRALCGVLQCPQRQQQGEEPQFLSGSLWVSYLFYHSTLAMELRFWRTKVMSNMWSR